MSVSVICAILGCLLWWIIVLFTVVYRLIKENDDLRRWKSLYEDLYSQRVNDCDDLKNKIDEYEKIFENIKSLMPF